MGVPTLGNPIVAAPVDPIEGRRASVRSKAAAASSVVWPPHIAVTLNHHPFSVPLSLNFYLPHLERLNNLTHVARLLIFLMHSACPAGDPIK